MIEHDIERPVYVRLPSTHVLPQEGSRDDAHREILHTDERIHGSVGPCHPFECGGLLLGRLGHDPHEDGQTLTPQDRLHDAPMGPPALSFARDQTVSKQACEVLVARALRVVLVICHQHMTGGFGIAHEKLSHAPEPDVDDVAVGGEQLLDEPDRITAPAQRCPKEGCATGPRRARRSHDDTS